MDEYAANVSAVVTAGYRLLQALRAREESDRDLAVADLEASAAKTPGAEFFRYQGAGITGQPAEQTPEEKLVGALLEFQTANVLIAAGQAVDSDYRGDQPTVQNTSECLKDALSSLEQTSFNLESPPLTFRFAGRTGPLVPTPPPPPIPRPKFNSDTKNAVQILIDESQSVLDRIVQQVKRLDPSTALNALDHLGDQVSGLDAVGRLIRWGVEKLQNAYQSLINLIGSDSLQKVKERVKKIWDDIKGETYSREVLGWIYEQKRIAELVDKICETPNLDEHVLGRADAEIEALVSGFRKYTHALRIIVDVVGTTTVVVGFTPFRESGTLLAGTAYFTILGALMLIGANYAGSAGLLRWVTGVGEVVAGVSPLSPSSR